MDKYINENLFNKKSLQKSILYFWFKYQIRTEALHTPSST